MICKICGKEFMSNKGFGGHIKQKHKIETKEYYDSYLKKENEGICICGNKTKFINIVNGYSKHCSLKCAHNDEESKIKRRKTNLERYGTENVLKSKEIRDKIHKTMLERYGSTEIFSTDHFKEKYKETSIKHFGVEHYTQQFKQNTTKITKTDNIVKINKTNKTNKTNKIDKTNNKNNNDIKSKSKIKSKNINNNKNQLQEQNYKKVNRLRYYEYDNIIFDSSWELAVYIWHKDHNINIIREPCVFEYIGLDYKKHKYFPDFKINNEIIEIKGPQYLDENGKLKDIAKQLCIDSNNIIIWSTSKIIPYIQYCEQKFNDKYWYRAFKYNTNYKPPHCKHTALINTPIKCCICNKEFQNGQYLSSHLKFQEHITGKDYYDKYIKKPNEGICIICGKPTKYINFTRGYTQTCSKECNNNPLSNKGKNISKTKQAFTDEKKQQIREKRENTCIERYGVKSNLLLINKGGDQCNGDS